MATLRRLRDGARRILATRALLGRTALARVRLDHGCASHEHAVIEWGGSHWRIRDLGSRNGTSVNHRACTSGWHELVAGDRLRFGGEEEAWIFEDDERPPPAAVGPRGGLIMGHADLLTLPEGDEPAACLKAAGGGWLLDRGDRVEPVSDGDVVEIAGTPWELLLPSGASRDSTLPRARELDLDSVTAVFEVDRTEEHVRIVLQQGARSIVLPDRLYHYMLLVLARARVHDHVVRGVSDAEAGWLYAATLASQLKVRPEKLNVDVFRARRLFAEHGVAQAADVIERRPHTAQLRLGVKAIRLVQQ